MHTAVAVAPSHQIKTDVHPIGCRLSPHTAFAAKQPHAAQVCCLMVSTRIIHVITWITTHLLTPNRWKPELAHSGHFTHE